MNIKIIFHLMPWELDFAELTFEKLSCARKYLNPEDTIYIQSTLNLSEYIFNWKDSSIPKSFFIEKYNNLLNYLEEYKVISNIYDKNELYGHLDLQRESLQQNIDYYISICPDMYFHNHLLFYLIESAKKINDKYFIITSETTQLWDYTWDEMVNKNFRNISYKEWNKQSPSELVHFIENNNDDHSLEKMSQFKYAGWFDLYNKNFYEKFIPVMDEWHGYGPWDFFGMNIASFAKTKYNTNIEQYILRNQIIFERNMGVFENKLNSNLYKKYLKLNDIPNQRKNFESKFQEYFIKWHDYAIKNNVL
jgi:hypothetical protein